jgi:hypothetical protein
MRPANQPTATGVVAVCLKKGWTPMIWNVSSNVLNENAVSIFRASEFGSCGQQSNEGMKIC